MYLNLLIIFFKFFLQDFASRQHQAALSENVLSNTEVASRMRSLFERSLQLHLTGEYMKVCLKAFILMPLPREKTLDSCKNYRQSHGPNKRRVCSNKSLSMLTLQYIAYLHMLVCHR